MLLEKIVSGVKEFLSPKQPNIITELDLTRCRGRQIEVETALGRVIQLSVGKSVSVVDDTLVDHVTINHAPDVPSDAVVQRVLTVGQSMVYSDSLDAYRSSLFVRTTRLKRITILY